LFGPTTKLFGHMIAGGFGALAVLFALIVWRLAAGPVSLAFLEPYVEEALSAENTGLTVSFDDLVLGWAGWDRTLDIRAIGVKARSAEAGALAGVPEMSIELSIPALSRGLVAPTRLELFGPGVRLIRNQAGGIDLGFGETDDGQTDPEGPDTLAAELLQELLLPPDPDRAMGYLEQVNVFEARLMLKDEVLGIEWIAPSAQVSLERHENGIRVVSDLSLDLPGEPLDLSATANYDTNSRLVAVALTFHDVDPARIAAAVPGLEDLADLAVPVSGNVDLVVAPEGHVIEAGFDISTGAGQILAPTPFPVGSVFDVALIQARGRIVSGLEALALEELYIDFGGPTLAMSGHFSGDPEAPNTNADLAIKGVPADQLGRYWPPEVSPEARLWLTEHMTAGHIDEVTLRLAIESADWPKSRLEPGKVTGTFAASDASLWYHTVLPPVDQIAVKGWFDTTQLHAITSGGVSGPLVLTEGAVDLGNIDTADGDANIAVSFVGPASETLAVLDLPPFGYATALGLDPATVSGGVEGDLAVALPLLEDLTLDDLAIGVAADLKSFSVTAGGMADLIGERRLDDGVASIVLDAEGFDLTGQALIEDVPVDVVWRENFATLLDAEEPRRRVALSSRLDDRARAAYGLDRPWITGPVDVTVDLEDQDAGVILAEVNVDADQAVIALPAFGWTKSTDVPAEARLALEISDREIRRVTNFGLRSEGLSTAGSAERDANGLWAINFDRLTSSLNDVSGQISMREDGGLAISLEGERLDLRPYFGDGEGDDSEEGSEQSAKPFDLSARVGVVVINDDMIMQGVQAQVSFDGNIISDAMVAGDLDGKYETILRLEDGASADTRAVTLASNDAGGVFKTLGVTEKMVGGELRLDAIVDDTQRDHPVTGIMTVDDFYMVDAPALAKILNVMTLTGALEMLQGDGMPFDKLVAPFVYRGDVLTVTNARANGLSMGLTMEGDIDIEGDWIDVSGTIVPAYLLNSALGNIPLLGDLFTGGEGKGMFAATYAVEGPRDDPDVLVNPLAALAPGILRELFTSLGAGDSSIRSEAGGGRTQ